jgi:hypothetical protein
VNLVDVERLLRERLDALGPAPRAELLPVLSLPDYDRARQMQFYSGDAGTSSIARNTTSHGAHITRRA